MAFDNDASSTFLPIPKVNLDTYGNHSRLVKDGYFMRPYADANMISKIEQLISSDDINTVLEDLSSVEIKAAKSRMKKLIAAINNSVIEGKTKLLESEDWDNDTMSEEMQIKWGKTHFNDFMNKVYVG